MGDAHRDVAELVGDVAASGEASCTAEDLFGDGGIEGEVHHGSVSARPPAAVKKLVRSGHCGGHTRCPNRPDVAGCRRRNSMRTFYDLQLGDRTVTKRELAG